MKILKFPQAWLAVAMLTAFAGQAAQAATIRIGATLSTTGPAASVGIHQKNSVQLLPRTLEGHDIEWIVLDDGTDTSTAVRNVNKLITESKVDVIVGPAPTPLSLAVIDTAAQARVPLFSLGGETSIAYPVDEKRRWIFKTPPLIDTVVSVIGEDFRARGFKTLAYVVSDDSFGSGFARILESLAEANGITIVAKERFNTKDSSVTGQALKVIAAKPDAVLVAAIGTSAVLPKVALRERGYAGQFYTTYASSSPEYLKLGGKAIEGTILPVGPILVVEQLPASNPVRETAAGYVKAYEEKFGANSRSTHGGHFYDAWLLIANALPQALKVAQPGTDAFRAALRDAIESTSNLPGTHGVFNLSPTDHVGLDSHSLVPVRVEGGQWKLLTTPGQAQ